MNTKPLVKVIIGLVVIAVVVLAYSCSSAQLNSKLPQKDGGSGSLRSEILVNNIPNPLNVHLLNAGSSAYEYCTFMAKHATMPPMPNVRIEVKNRSTGEVKSYVPVVLAEKRKNFSLQTGGIAELSIYHRGVKLAPGDYKVVVLLYQDEDVDQKTPISVSKPLLVSVSP